MDYQFKESFVCVCAETKGQLMFHFVYGPRLYNTHYPLAHVITSMDNLFSADG